MKKIKKFVFFYGVYILVIFKNIIVENWSFFYEVNEVYIVFFFVGGLWVYYC